MVLPESDVIDCVFYLERDSTLIIHLSQSVLQGLDVSLAGGMVL